MRYTFILISLFALVSFARAQQGTLTVHFDTDSTTILPHEKAFLDSITTHIAATGITAVHLIGYADNSGDNDYNVRLSLRRAHAVRDYLHSKGWPDSLFRDVDGLGSSHPLNDNSSDGEKSLNRRVEIIIQRPRTATLQDIFKDTANLIGKNIVLPNANFYAGRHVLLPQSYKVLQELFVIMREHPTLHIEIQGYVCCNSDGFDGLDEDTHAPDLSVQRAKFVYDFLIRQGINKDRVKYKGFGSSNKIFPEEKDDIQAAANRRVEIKIVSFGPRNPVKHPRA